MRSLNLNKLIKYTQLLNLNFIKSWLNLKKNYTIESGIKSSTKLCKKQKLIILSFLSRYTLFALYGRTAERTKWIHQGTKASNKIKSVVLAKSLQNHNVKLFPAEQKFPAEAFPSVINSFAPKLLNFHV